MENDNWIAEFRGLFWGEGCADIRRFTRKRSKRYFFAPRLRITMRADERPMVEEIHRRLGGNIEYGEMRSNSGTRPSVTWSLSTKKEVVRVCDLLLKAEFPAKKLQQIKHVREAAYLRVDGTSHMPDVVYNRLNELYEMVRQLKRFE